MILKGRVKVDDKWMSNTRENIAFCIDVFNLSMPNNLAFAENFKCKVGTRFIVARGVAQTNK